jgi:exodeoxyribonuclease V gamma subunit
VEGLQALLLGEVLSFLDGLFAWMEEGARARSAPEWAHWLETALSRFLGWSEGTGADRGIERVLENLRAGRGNGAAGFDREALVFLLGRWLEETMEGRGGGVRVGGINLYRGVPARVIVLLGLNDGLFPRREETTGFDLRQAPRPGDPDPAESDRQAFLEAVLSAREALVITHTGCAADGTTEVPPSPVVDDLLETLERMGPGVTSLREAVVRAHPLQPWSPRIFTAGNGFTYDPREVERVRAAQGCSSQSPAFAPEALPAPPTDGPLALEALQAFFADPAGSFLAERLGAIPPRPEELLPEHEPLPEENRRGYAIRRELFEALCRAEAPEAALARLEGRGMLPAGQTGAQAVAVYLDQARQLAGLVQSRAAGREPAEVPLAGEAVHGRLYPVYGDTLVAVRPGKLRARDRMEGWLALLCAAAAGIPVTEAVVAGTDGVCRLAPPESAAELLAALLELREEGMRRPLALFPESAWAAANRLKRAKPEAEAYAAAWQSWRGNPRTATFAESTRPANQLCFPGEPVFDAAFLEHVRQSYLPLAQHLNDEGKARAS